MWSFSFNTCSTFITASPSTSTLTSSTTLSTLSAIRSSSSTSTVLISYANPIFETTLISPKTSATKKTETTLSASTITSTAASTITPTIISTTTSITTSFTLSASSTLTISTSYANQNFETTWTIISASITKTTTRSSTTSSIISTTTSKTVSYTLGLTNYWPFNGSPVDVVGGMNLTIKQNGSFVMDRFGNNKSALYLNSGYALAPAGVYFNCSAGYTIMTWIKLVSTGTFPSFLEFSNGKFMDTVILFFGGSGGTTLYSTTANSTNSGWVSSAYSKSLELNVWIHAATTVNSTANIFYINGTQNIITAGSTCKAILRTSCKIGRRDWYPSNTDLNGVLDDLKIFKIRNSKWIIATIINF